MFEDCCHFLPPSFSFKAREQFDLCPRTELATQPVRRDPHRRWSTVVFDDLWNVCLISWWASPKTSSSHKNFSLISPKANLAWSQVNREWTNTLSMLSFLLWIDINVSVSVTSSSLQFTGLTKSCPTSEASTHSNWLTHRILLLESFPNIISLNKPPTFFKIGLIGLRGGRNSHCWNSQQVRARNRRFQLLN